MFKKDLELHARNHVEVKHCITHDYLILFMLNLLFLYHAMIYYSLKGTTYPEFGFN